MASIIQAISQCLGGPESSKANTSASVKEQAIASDVLQILFTAEQGGPNLEKSLQESVSGYGWTENIAKAIFGGMENALKQGVEMGAALKEAFNEAVRKATGFAKDHPVYCALIALGILVILAPWVLEALGFAELGPVEGSFAAGWQSRYAGYVPKQSLFSFFQRLGMVWRRSVVSKGTEKAWS